MQAVRFHGRGGQGAKTASRILGTAAFLEGYLAQDSPIYGAERRGAPVAAFTRIAKEPIRERGIIARPDLVVIADASLINDPAARVLDGIDERTAVFVNSPLTAEQLGAQTSLAGRLTTLDLTDIALQQFGKRERDQRPARCRRRTTRRTPSGVDPRGDCAGACRPRTRGVDD